MSVRNLMRRARGVLTGLDVVTQRLDQIHARIDSHSGALEGLRDGVPRLHQEIAECASRVQAAALVRRIDSIEALLVQMRAVPRGAVPSLARTDTTIESAQPSTEIGHGSRRLAFLVNSQELVNHFAPVWDQLPSGAFDVILHGPEMVWAQQALHRWRCVIRASRDVLDEQVPYSFLVSNHPVEAGEASLIKRLAQRNVRFMYAAGKSGWNLADWNSLYDVILCFGPHHATAFAASTDACVVQMGYPRFDRFFTEPKDVPALRRRFGCDPHREVVVWLPTWKELSSVGLFDAEMSALTDQFNVVIKVHPLMVEQEPNRVAALSRHPFTHLITDASDNLPLYQLADYVVCDYGGPALAAVYTDKRLLLLKVPGAQDNPLLGPDSPDEQLHRQLGEVCAGEGCVRRLLSDPSHWAAQTSLRRALRRSYFAPHYGFAASVAAQSLMKLELLVENAAGAAARTHT